MIQLKVKSARLLFIPMAAASSFSFAAKTTFNGFASFVGGMVVESTELPNGEDTTYTTDFGFSNLGLNEKSAYADYVSYSPDSSYALQVKSDLNQELSVAAQVSGRGAQDFNAVLEWAYLSYNITPSLTLQAGRQRTPLYHYSDFIDVGYAYHWIRPPVEVYNNSFPTYEGVSLTYTASLGNWATKARLYSGTTENRISRFGTFGAESMYGTNISVSNDYIQLRASALSTESYTSDPTGKDNTAAAFFGSLSANFSLGGAFLFSEVTTAATVEDDEYFFIPGVNLDLDQLGSTMVSIGYEVGTVTPHLTFAESYLDLFDGNNPVFADQSVKRATVTGGIRWDFHPSAAFKFEYSSTTDESTDLIIQTAGKTAEADLVSFGFDLIF